MKREHPLYLSFLDSLQKGEIATLDLFKEPEFWGELDGKEKSQLATLFLKRAEEEEERLTEASCLAEQLAGDEGGILFHISALLFRFGASHEHKESLLLALDKMVQIEEKTPDFFVHHPKGWHLWGNLLVALHHLHADDAFLEQAIEKYEKAIDGAKHHHLPTEDLYWDLANAFFYLGERSNEWVDLKKSVECYEKVAGPTRDPEFWVDYARALAAVGSHLGEPSYGRQAIHILQEVIAKIGVGSQEKDHKIYGGAWSLYALIVRQIVELTHDEDELLQCDRIFQEALLANPDQPFLCLAWGELYLHMGWYHKEISYLDRGLEKLTSLKAQEADPTHLSALVSIGLALLGLMLDDIRLIKEGERRVVATVETEEGAVELLVAAGVVFFAKGCYFGEEKALRQALGLLEKAARVCSTSLFIRHLIFESSLRLVEMKGEKKCAKKAVAAISRASALAPRVPLFWNEWGIALLKVYFLEKSPALYLERALEKFEKGLSCNPENPDLKGLFHYGFALDLNGERMGDPHSLAKAIEIFSQIVERAPDFPAAKVRLSISYFHAAKLENKIDTYYRAIDLFEAIVAEDKEHESSWYGLGITLLYLSEAIRDPVQGEEEKELKTRAERALMHAVELGNGEAHFRLACLYSLKGESEKALTHLHRAHARNLLPSLEEMQEEEWLKPLRGVEAFHVFMRELGERDG